MTIGNELAKPFLCVVGCAELAAAGHDRCIIPIKAEHIDAWLSPDSSNTEALYSILDDRERPYYEHRLAA